MAEDLKRQCQETAASLLPRLSHTSLKSLSSSQLKDLCIQIHQSITSLEKFEEPTQGQAFATLGFLKSFFPAVLGLHEIKSNDPIASIQSPFSDIWTLDKFRDNIEGSELPRASSQAKLSRLLQLFSLTHSQV